MPCDLKIVLDNAQKQSLTENDLGEISYALARLSVQDRLRIAFGYRAYVSAIDGLLNAPDINHRTVAYMILSYGKDSSRNNILIARLATDTDVLPLTWLASALISNNVTSTAGQLFAVFVRYPKLPLDILFPQYVRMQPDAIKRVCRSHLHDTAFTAKVYAMQGIAYFGKDVEVDSLARACTTAWDMKDKGWAISTLEALKASHLKTLLQPYESVPDLQMSVINALRSSPNPEDRLHGETLFALWKKASHMKY